MPAWLILEEATKHLKDGESSLCQIAREGGIPDQKYRCVWRCDTEELDAWLKSGGTVTLGETPWKKSDQKP